ncbi:MAG: SlyX protein [Alteromonadaceae bacterium]|uniref:SlyX family protein n=1 Tax=unclassified Marinobacter TaxID=83889 RepID=UPI000C57CE64|nr:SlyX family protein [Marinobacter sp. BGYM27]MAA64482.1 SlyX protein [Alteromonadaceae bacterium]MBH85875.1 SlyX protein [Alteromonadaceae bacterium]MDG5498662.1 SlyX family protein [Marinobacter sp. BGYM27]
MTLEQLEARMNDLETRVAFQDDMIATLNDQVAQQELDIRLLWEAKKRLNKQVSDLSPSNIRSEEDETPPPHY